MTFVRLTETLFERLGELGDVMHATDIRRLETLRSLPVSFRPQRLERRRDLPHIQ